MAIYNEIPFTEIENLRLDAEFYQPYFFEILHKIGKLNGGKLWNYADTVKRIFKPKDGQPFRYIEISRVSTKNGSIEAIEVPGEEAPSRAQYIVRTGDILISLVRPERNAVGLVTEDLDGAVCSSGFHVLAPRRDIASEYLFAYLKSKPIVDLLARRVTATMYPAVLENDVLSLPFFIPPNEIYHDIVSRVSQAFELRRQSNMKYDEAEELLISNLGFDTSLFGNAVGNSALT